MSWNLTEDEQKDLQEEDTLESDPIFGSDVSLISEDKVPCGKCDRCRCRT